MLQIEITFVSNINLYLQAFKYQSISMYILFTLVLHCHWVMIIQSWMFLPKIFTRDFFYICRDQSSYRVAEVFAR